MDINTGRLTPLERRLQAWPFWKKLLLVFFGFALFGLAVGCADFAVWIVDLWRV